MQAGDILENDFQSKVNIVGESIYYAETVAGSVRISFSKKVISSLSFIDHLPQVRKMIPTPPKLMAVFSARKIGNGSALNPRGNQFQNKVWNALLEVPFGDTCTYGKIAEKIGRPGHARAVAGAISRNKIAIIVPCHRIKPVSGKLGGYRWGFKRKEIILRYEKESKNLNGIFKQFFECENK